MHKDYSGKLRYEVALMVREKVQRNSVGHQMILRRERRRIGI